MIGNRLQVRHSSQQILSTIVSVALVGTASLLVGANASSGRLPDGPPPATKAVLLPTSRHHQLGELDVRGLGSVRAEGVPARPVIEAAETFLKNLTPDQHARSQFPQDSAAWLDQVSEHAASRPGLRLASLAPLQRTALLGLLDASMTARGMSKLDGISRLRAILGQVDSSSANARFTLLGTPSSDEPWGWELRSPHFLIHYLIAGDQVVVTPTDLDSSVTSIAAGSL